MRCEYCKERLSRIINIFSKYPFALEGSTDGKSSSSRTLYFCDADCQWNYVLWLNEKQRKQQVKGGKNF
jgi:hypothetical protein